MTIHTYVPRIEIVLNKNVDRQNGKAQRLNGSSGELNLEKYLGDNGEVTVSSAIGECMGTFSIRLPDQPDPEVLDSLYGALEPMDHVTIRMAHGPTGEGPLPVVMRGFIHSVRREESIGGGGSGPQRFVVLEGNNYGLIFNNLHIFKTGKPAVEEKLKAAAKSYAEYDGEPVTPDAFMQRIVDDVVNSYIDDLYFHRAVFDDGWTDSDVNIDTDLTVTEGKVNLRLQVDDAQIWNLIARAADFAFNELFIEDREQAPFLVHRPLPFKDLEGNWIENRGQKVFAEEVEVDIADVVSLNVARTEHDISNYWWLKLAVRPPDNVQLSRAVHGADDFTATPGYENCSAELYGVRRMEKEILIGPPALDKKALVGRPQSREELDRHSRMYTDWLKDGRDLLFRLNRDNGVYETGSMVLRGNEAVRIGRYIKLKRGNITAEYYARRVTHNFSGNGVYQTTVEFVRGTGFLVRSMSESSPYLLEGRKGPYDQ